MNKHNFTTLPTLTTLAAIAAGLAVSACSKETPIFAIMGKSQSFGLNAINNKVDILWVIRNAGLMGPMQTNLATSVNSFMSQFVGNQFNFQIAVVTTDVRPVDPSAPNDPNQSGQGACIVGTPPIIIPTTPNPISALAANADVGYFGTTNSQGLNAVELALSNPNLTGCNNTFLRPDAYLAVIEFSDVDDDTTTTPEQTIAFLDGVKPPTVSPTGATIRPYSMNGIVVDNAADQAVCDALGNQMFGTTGQSYTEIGTKFITAASETSGVIADICASNFSAGLLTVANNILIQTTAVRLASVPNQTTIVVWENGGMVPNDPNNGWTFDSASTSIFFHGSALPVGANTSISVDYTPIALD